MIPSHPPAAPELPALDRRSLLKGGALSLGLVGMPLAAQGGFRGFTHGVASGEPGRDRVLLWTRYAAAQPTAIEWEVSDSPDFARTMAAGAVTASPERDWCCKSWAEGLAPGRWYYYRFVAPDGVVSDIGRTRTLPEGEAERFRMAVFSCSNIGFGWFNAYAHAAESDEFDLTLHLGDYLYEYPLGNYPSAAELVPGRGSLPLHETVALADYRQRYASYRTDKDLRRLHQLYPMIANWDDHESANDSYSGGAENHQPDTEGAWSVRKAAAMQAYREWMPVSDEPWAAYEIGQLATLFRLETRLAARNKPPSIADVLEGKGSPDSALAALTAFRDGAWRDPAREMLGKAQQTWLAEGLARSKRAGKTWQVLAQQVLMGNLSAPASLADGLTDEVPAYVRERVLRGALSANAGLPLNMDAWDGYPAARARVFAAALAADANLISLAGDTHNGWAFELAQEGSPVGVEFGGHSVTSPGIETFLPQIRPADLARASIAENPQLKWTDSGQRGYMAVELTPERAVSEFRFVGNVRERSARLAGRQRIATRAGTHRLDIG